MSARAPSREAAVCCAYDGSVNGHWIARYAIHLAAGLPVPRLRLVHAWARRPSPALLAHRLDHVIADGERAGVAVSVHEVRETGDVAQAVLGGVPAGPHAMLVCGARARPGSRGVLAGTVSERLLRAGHCHVLVLRVLQPGLLGAPRRLLLPLAGNPGEARAAAPFLRLLLPGAQELRLLRVMVARRGAPERSTAEGRARLRGHGQAAITAFENELRDALALEDTHLDAHVRIADDWAEAALVLAGQHRAELVLAGASPRELASGRLRASALERLLEDAPCDAGVYRALA